MAVSGVKRNFSYLFGILTVVVYLIGLLLLINRELGIRNVLIIISALIAYYIANVYNIVANRYRLRDMATVIVINTIFMSLTVFLGFFSLYEGIILFGTVSLFQIVFRYIVNMSMIERQKILFVGQNDYTSDLLESIKKDDQYKLIGFLKDEKKEVLKNAILKICEVKKSVTSGNSCSALPLSLPNCCKP